MIIIPGVDKEEFGALLALLHWQKETGRRLPMAADEIIRLEASGQAIDLDSGEVWTVPPEPQDEEKVVA